MKQTTLRSLAKSFAKGEIDKERYRHARTELINGILSGEIPLPVNDYPALVKPPKEESLEVTERRPEKKKRAPIVTDSEPQPPSHSLNILWLLGGAIAITAILIAALLLTGHKTAPGNNVNSTAIPAADSLLKQTTAAQTLIQVFLNDNNWDETSLNEFLLKWRELSEEQMEAVKNSVELIQLSNAIHKQLLEERALSGLAGADGAMSKQQQLLAFAKQLGIEEIK
ncbi:MAG: hypothetical protein ACE5GZ_09130 [Gammaproteobacteria bacterium]